MALEASGCDQAHVLHKPQLLSDNGASYISGELKDYIQDNDMSHVRGAPYNPQTQGSVGTVAEGRVSPKRTVVSDAQE